VVLLLSKRLDGEAQRRQTVFLRNNLSGGGPFDCGRRWPSRHSLLLGCSSLAALPTPKIPRRSTAKSFRRMATLRQHYDKTDLTHFFATLFIVDKTVYVKLIIPSIQ
jgi:hypothetical protein